MGMVGGAQARVNAKSWVEHDVSYPSSPRGRDSPWNAQVGYGRWLGSALACPSAELCAGRPNSAAAIVDRRLRMTH